MSFLSKPATQISACWLQNEGAKADAGLFKLENFVSIKPVYLTLFVGAVLSTGCPKEEPSRVAATKATAANATTSGPGQKQHASACDMVTASEMSAIVGAAVTAAAGGNERPPRQTECEYVSAAGTSLGADLQVDWGAGDPKAMGAATGLVNSVAASAVDPLQGATNLRERQDKDVKLGH
jgi:hypothetical protein